MMWVASQTRSDISYKTCVMSNTGKHPKVKMLQEANKALSKLKAKICGIEFPNLGNPKKNQNLSIFRCYIC